MEQHEHKGNTDTCTSLWLVRGNKVLLGLRHYKSFSTWTTPGGRCEQGETVGNALRRETEEETGIKDFEITKFIGEFPGKKHPDRVFIFLGSSDEEPQLMEPEKFSEWKWFGFDDFPDNFINEASLPILKDLLRAYQS